MFKRLNRFMLNIYYSSWLYFLANLTSVHLIQYFLNLKLVLH
jgi:hypothetical protein